MVLSCNNFVTFLFFVTNKGFYMSTAANYKREQSRKWLLTINNPVEKGFSHEYIKVCLSSLKNLDYWCMCDEVGESQTYHTHLFIFRKNQIRFNTLKKLFPSAHIDYCLGTALQNREYIMKKGINEGTLKEKTNLSDTFEEFGVCPEEKQGARNDLEELYSMIKDGYSDFEILEANPNHMKRLDSIERTRQIILFKEFEEKFRELEVVYRYGKSGTGKSKSIIDRYGFKNVYRVTDNKHPFDSYAGQDVIVFEEFYSSNWRINDMLNFLDIYPLKLPCRYNNKQACYTKVYINSNIPLEKQYTTIQKEFADTWQAFLRRITCVQIFKNDDDIQEYNDINLYLNREEWVSFEEYENIPLLFY